MEFSHKLIKGHLVKRYKRFLADVRLETGQVVTAHCPNTGGMLGCCEPNSVVWLRYSPSEKRKLDYSWELVNASEDGELVGIYSARANQLVAEALVNQKIIELVEYSDFKQEVTLENSRLDFALFENDKAQKPNAYMEVKSVTAISKNTNEEHMAIFPDAKTQRGIKHIHELIELKKQGFDAVLFFCVQRNGVKSMRAAWEFDQEYAAALELAEQKGVKIIAYTCLISSEGITLDHSIPIVV